MDNSKIIKIAFLFIAIILGAGFASGQELMKFFVRYGNNGFIGIILSGIIFFLVGWAVMELSIEYKTKNYSQFLEKLIGRGFALFMESVVSCFLFVLFSAMLAASGATSAESFYVPNIYGIVGMAALCFVCFLGDTSKLLKISAALSPILIVGGLFIGLFSYFTSSTPTSSGFGDFLGKSFVVSAIIYASYNIITAITVLAAIPDIASKKKIAFKGALLGSLLMTILGICMALPLVRSSFLVDKVQVPLLKIASMHGDVLEYFYLFVLFIAIFTTALVNGFAFINWLCYRFKMNEFAAKFLLIFASFFAAQIGFSEIIGKVYPLFGFIGLFQILIILSIFFIHKLKKIC